MRKTLSFDEILIEYWNRQYRFRYPVGGVKPSGVWLPAKQEHCSCCEIEIEKGNAFACQMYIHCCTIEHICELYNVDIDKMRKYIHKLDMG